MADKSLTGRHYANRTLAWLDFLRFGAVVHGAGATVLVLALLWGCTVAVGLDHGLMPGDLAGNPDLRIAGGHFERVADPHSPTDNLVGRIVTSDGAKLRIDAVVPDPNDNDHEIVLYRFSRLAANGTATPFCNNGSGLGFPIAGTWSADGSHLRTPGQFSVICVGTAAARCVALGYRPWRKGPDGVDLWDFHEACVRALRADYCGSGRSHATVDDGVAVYDEHGIHPLRPAQGMSFEAAWGAGGATCVNHMRAPARMSLKDLRTECPNLPETKLGSSCDERNPALIFTKSPSPHGG